MALSVLVNLTLNVFASSNFPTAQRSLFLAPFVYLFVAAGVSRIPSKIFQPLLLVVLIFPNVVAMRQTYAHPSWEDWRGVARYVEDNWQADDLIVFSPGYINIAFDRYSKNEHRELGYPKGLMDPARMFWGYHYMRGPDEAVRFLLQNSEAVRRSSRIWLIQSHNILYDLDKRIPDATMVVALENRASTKVEVFKKFDGVHVYLYSIERKRSER